MTVGIALVLIFVLYLIDKHSRWWQAFKLTVGMVVLGIVGIGGFFGCQQYRANREKKQEQAELAARQAKFSCVANPDASPKALDFSDLGGHLVSPAPGEK